MRLLPPALCSSPGRAWLGGVTPGMGRGRSDLPNNLSCTGSSSFSLQGPNPGFVVPLGKMATALVFSVTSFSPGCVGRFCLLRSCKNFPLRPFVPGGAAALGHSLVGRELPSRLKLATLGLALPCLCPRSETAAALHRSISTSRVPPWRPQPNVSSLPFCLVHGVA